LDVSSFSTSMIILSILAVPLLVIIIVVSIIRLRQRGKWNNCFGQWFCFANFRPLEKLKESFKNYANLIEISFKQFSSYCLNFNNLFRWFWTIEIVFLVW
jgi:hypothetical protein